MARLTQLFLMLSSDQDGEVVAAARAIGRHLKAEGKDWHWLAALLDGKVKPMEPQPMTWQEAVEVVLERYPNHLSPWEFDFMGSMHKWRRKPSPKQAVHMADIFMRFNMDVRL